VDPKRLDTRLATIRASVRQYLGGIEATASVFPLGALHLAASLIDALARLTCDAKGGDLARYEWFLKRYLPSVYQVDDLPKQLYAGLRSVGLHNLSVGRRLALMDGQLDRATHLKVDSRGRRIIRVEEFLGDLRSAVDSWENDVNEHDELKERVVERERRNPVFEIIMIEIPETFQSVATTSSLPVTGVAHYPMTGVTASASAAVGSTRFRLR
jgi:hypothetical protein